MKFKVIHFKTLSTIISISLLLFSCKKQNIQLSASASNSSDDIVVAQNTEQTVVKYRDVNGRTKLQLRPGLNDGQDSYTFYLASDPSWANGNGNFAEELTMMNWTLGGSSEQLRSYIKFDSLVLVPSTAKIVSATLNLYAKGSSVANPSNGNSVYPGSPYVPGAPDNSCWVEAVTGNSWNESTITWNNQPPVTTTGRVSISSSTSQWAYNSSVDVTTLVKKMVANPSKNLGFRLSLANEAPYRSMIFASSENTDVNKRPQLVIVYK